MLLTLAFLLGALVGWRRATTRGGDRLDQLQYGVVHGIAFVLVVVVLLVIVGRVGYA